MAPVILEQLPPSLSQRFQANVYVTGAVPSQVPFVAVSVEPSFAEPEMVGGAVFEGLTALAAWPSRAAPKTAPIVSAEMAISSAVSHRRP